MNKRKLLVWIPVIALLLNGVGYLIYRSGRTSSKPIPAASETGGLPAPIVQERRIEPAIGNLDPNAPRNDEEERKTNALARRAAGLAALEAGNYDSALINFTEARALLGDKANVADLLRVTQDLRKGGKVAARSRETGPAREPSAPRNKSHASRERVVAVKDEPAPPESNPVQAAPAPGLLIVTTTPRGLLVQVDDTPIDLTPMRTKVRPGSHRIALLDGDRKIYETTVDVKEGSTATLLKDFAPETAPEAPRAAAAIAPAAPVAPAAARNDAPRSASASTPTPSPPPGTRVTPPSVPSGDTATGTLDIVSPGLYGVVWINGRPRGYPPLVVRDLPAGATKIEVRVNGIQKRSATIFVKPGLTTPVKLGSQETVL